MHKAMGIAAVCVALGACALTPNEVSPRLNGLPGVAVVGGPYGYPIIKGLSFTKPPLASGDRLPACIKRNADLTTGAPSTLDGSTFADGKLSFPVRTVTPGGFYEVLRYTLTVTPATGVYAFERLQVVRNGQDMPAFESASPENAYAKFQELADQIDRCAR